MALRPAIPYTAPESVLPAPLPSTEEILKAELISKRRAAVALVGEFFIVKYGPRVQLQEGENMLLVQQCTNVPVPTVYTLYHDEETNWNFIVMEDIPGRSLSSAWKDMNASQKTAVALQLRRNMDELRRMPSPGYYGGIWRQKSWDFTFMASLLGLPIEDEAIIGPQETEEQWADAMWGCLDVRMKTPAREKLPVFRKLYQALFKGHASVSTHADFRPGNMILRNDDKGVVIIDWECAGWYPTFWEYCRAMTWLNYSSDWWEYIPSILDQYVGELGWMMWHDYSSAM